MKDKITFADFQKLDLKVGTIVEVERIEGSDKLYKLIVDLGQEKRQLVTGMVPFYSPDQLQGKQIVVLLNLEPREIKGVESQGMLLAADIDGKPILIEPEKEVPNGTIVR